MAKEMYCLICERKTDENCVLYCDHYAGEDCLPIVDFPIEDMKEEDDGLQDNR